MTLKTKYAILLKKYNLPHINLQSYQQHFNFPVEHYYCKLGFDFSKQHSFYEISAHYMDTYNKKRTMCKLQRNALEIIKLINDNGISQSILSA